MASAYQARVRETREAQKELRRVELLLDRAEARIRALEEPGFHAFVNTARTFLRNYPADIFDGSSGDPGPVFVAGLRRALDAFDAARGDE